MCYECYDPDEGASVEYISTYLEVPIEDVEDVIDQFDDQFDPYCAIE